MKNAVVICEFNPLHVGHKRLLDCARSAGAENVLCVMSGSAVQRGELACLDKYARARHAVLAGADAVIELPAEYTLSAAKQFALGGVKIANLVKDATLVFGSECGDVSELEKAALAACDPAVGERIRANLKKGLGYPASLSAATGNALLENFPNNTLGTEYIKAIIDTGRKISYFTVKRENSPSTDAPNGYPTSSSLRDALKNGFAPDASFVPSYVAEDLAKHRLNDDKLYAILRYVLTSSKKKGVYDDAEGLSNRLSVCAGRSLTYEEFCSAAAAKRYTRARIRRLALNTAVGNFYTHAELTEKPVRFVNILAVAKGKEDVLSQICAPVAVSRRTRAPFEEEFALTARTDSLFRAARYDFEETSPFLGF